MDLFLILRKARLFEANKHFLSDWLASEYLVKKKKKKRKGTGVVEQVVP